MIALARIEMILFLCVAVPLAWLASEFQNRRGVRIALGLCAIGMCFLVAAGVGGLERLNSNAWYGSASKGLIDTTLVELEAGNTEKVIRELKTLQSGFLPTYENRARYDHLVNEYITRLGHKPTERLSHNDPLPPLDGGQQKPAEQPEAPPEAN